MGVDSDPSRDIHFKAGHNLSVSQPQPLPCHLSGLSWGRGRASQFPKKQRNLRAKRELHSLIFISIQQEKNLKTHPMLQPHLYQVGPQEAAPAQGAPAARAVPGAWAPGTATPCAYELTAGPFLHTWRQKGSWHFFGPQLSALDTWKRSAMSSIAWRMWFPKRWAFVSELENLLETWKKMVFSPAIM